MIIWIASFPKSGNTWVRALISTYLNLEKNKFNLNLISKIPKFAQDSFFSSFIDLNDIKKDPLKISQYWIHAQSKINLDNKIKFFKTHNVCASHNGNWFTDEINTSGYIYIVRDPRAVVNSYANHMKISNEKAVDKITNENLIGFHGDYNLPEFVSSWKKNYLSWKKKKKFPGIVIKYEDLIDQTGNQFNKILSFLSDKINIKIDEKKIIETIKYCKFSNLSKLEKADGFNEAVGGKFFRKGKKDSWKKELSLELQKKIEENFKEEMIELGYM